MLLVLGAILVGLLWPAVGSGPPSKRSQSGNNLKIIGLAMEMYRERDGVLPARAILSADGKPLLSWRVSLLPWLGGAELYKEFHLDEAWDSPHNIALIDKMPMELNTPKALSRNQTHYLAVVGKGTMFESTDAPKPDEVTDDPNNTIMIVEADHAVPWTKPEELEFDAKAPRRSLQGLYPSGAMVLMANGSARLLPKEMDDETVRGLVTKDGNEDVRLP